MLSRAFGNVLGRKWSFLAVVFLIPVLLAPVLSTQAAEEDKEDKRKFADVKTRQRHAVGQKCAKLLETVQETVAAENWKKAESELRAAMGELCDSSYEKSQVWNYLGFVYYSQERYRDAITAYSNMTKEPDVDEQMKISTWYTVAQLYFVLEDYASAARQLEQWMREATIVGPDAKVLLAQAYYQLDRKNDALKFVNEAITEQEAKGSLPKESWWGLQRVLYYEKGEFRKVADILKKLIKHYPKYTYWRQLGGMYGELDQDMNKLVSFEVPYLDGALNEERQLMGLSYMFLSADAPYLAARVIEKGFKEDRIEQTADNLEVLGLAWQQAQDSKRALPVLEKAAKLSDKGKLWARLAGVYLDLGQNKKAVLASRNAIRKGSLERDDLTYMVLGNAQLNLHCYNDARKAFRQAAKDKRSAKYANQWMAYAEKEGVRREKLRESGANIKGCTRV